MPLPGKNAIFIQHGAVAVRGGASLVISDELALFDKGSKLYKSYSGQGPAAGADLGHGAVAASSSDKSRESGIAAVTPNDEIAVIEENDPIAFDRSHGDWSGVVVVRENQVAVAAQDDPRGPAIGVRGEGNRATASCAREGAGVSDQGRVTGVGADAEFSQAAAGIGAPAAIAGESSITAVPSINENRGAAGESCRSCPHLH